MDDNIKIYLRDIGKYPLLSKEEEIFLAKTIERSNTAKDKLNDPLLLQEEREKYEEEVRAGKSARKTLTNSNLRLVVSFAKKYHAQPQHLSLLDLIQEGNTGLARAVEKFDWRRGFRFSTYASWWIRQAITRAIADKNRDIRLPSHMGSKVSKLAGACSSIAEEEGREPTAEEMAAEAGLPVETVNQIIRATQDPASLETPVGGEGDNNIGEFVPDSTADPAEEAVDKVYNEQLRAQVRSALTALTPREQRVLGLRFGLDGGRPRTLEEVGIELKVTRERIRQIEAKALRKLRHPSINSKLKEYLE